MSREVLEVKYFYNVFCPEKIENAQVGGNEQGPKKPHHTQLTTSFSSTLRLC